MTWLVWLLTISGLVTIFSTYCWAMAKVRLKAAVSEKKELEKAAKFSKNKLEALEKHFSVAPYSTYDSNVIMGMRCSTCGEDYSICEDHTTHTIVCPKCFKVMSAFKIPKEG